MSYPMTHLCVAKKVFELNPNIVINLPQYYLGNLAPDSVHFREGFKPDDKKVSHLCPDSERWGESSDDEKWTGNVLSFLRRHRESGNIDFIYGFCTHILVDIRNNIDFWTPLKLKLYNSLKLPDDNIYDSEARKVSRLDEINADNRLHSAAFEGEIQDSLCKAKGISIEGVIIEEEVDRIRDNILYTQYKNAIVDDSYVGKYVTYEGYRSFIDRTAGIVGKLIF